VDTIVSAADSTGKDGPDRTLTNVAYWAREMRPRTICFAVAPGEDEHALYEALAEFRRSGSSAAH
jgi:hypothetical protein